jgi:hypothetical protein
MRETTMVRSYGRFCLELLFEECGSLDPSAPIDPRYISCLLLEG